MAPAPTAHMRILFIGKYPPIQGGVAWQGFALVELLASAGHFVHVVSDSFSVEADYRTILNADDLAALQLSDTPWACNVAFDFILPFSADRQKIPRSGMAETLLFGRCSRVIGACRFDLVISNYIFPYGIVAEWIRKYHHIPHILMHAGSDLFDLFNEPDLRVAAISALSNATSVVTSEAGAEMLAKAFINPRHCATDIRYEAAFPATPLTSATDPHIYLSSIIADRREDVERLRSAKLKLLVVGKSGPTKGTFHIIDAVKHLVDEQIDVCCLAAWSGLAESRAMDYIVERNVNNNFVIIPPIPRWRIPAAFKCVDAILYLEHDFWLRCHTPLIPIEIKHLGAVGIFPQNICKALNSKLPNGDAPSWVEVPGLIAPSVLAESIAKADFAALSRKAKSHAAYFRIGADDNRRSITTMIDEVVSRNERS